MVKGPHGLPRPITLSPGSPASEYHLNPMNKIISLILLIGGIALFIFGISASNSLGSDVSNFFTGTPTDKAVWMLVGGAIIAALGFFGTFRKPRHG